MFRHHIVSELTIFGISEDIPDTVREEHGERELCELDIVHVLDDVLMGHQLGDTLAWDVLIVELACGRQDEISRQVVKLNNIQSLVRAIKFDRTWYNID